jgi:hypothetical protein
MTSQPPASPAYVSENALWIGLLGGPLAWLVQLAVSYPLVPLSCAIEWGAIFHLITLITALAAIAAGSTAWQAWQRAPAPSGPTDTRLARQRFMALSGVLTSALFLATILAQWLPVWFLSPCSIAP